MGVRGILGSVCIDYVCAFRIMGVQARGKGGPAWVSAFCGQRGGLSTAQTEAVMRRERGARATMVL